MTVKQVLKLTMFYIGREDLLKYSIFGGEDETIPTAAEQAEIDKLVKCLNLVIKEIATDYMPLKRRLVIQVRNKMFEFDTLPDTLLDVVSLKTLLGIRTKCEIFPSHLACEDGKYELTYHYLPDELEIDDDIPNFYGKLDERVFAFGTAMEHSYSNCLFDDAQLWENRYKTALLCAGRKRREMTVAKRGWF